MSLCGVLLLGSGPDLVRGAKGAIASQCEDTDRGTEREGRGLDLLSSTVLLKVTHLT